MKKLVLWLLIFLTFSQLARAEILTDKEAYKPGNVVKIDLIHSKPLVDVKIKIIDPNGKEMFSKPMNNVSSTHWNYSYTLSKKALNGTYTIDISALLGEAIINMSTPILKFNKTFDVLPWKINAFLEKYTLIPGESLNFTFFITEKYSEKLTFDIFYSLKDPLGNEIVNYTFTLTEANKGFFEIYKIPKNFTLGTYTITVNLTDSDNRFASVRFNFSLVKPLSITPQLINETTTNKIFKKIFVLENFGTSDINVESIELSENLRDIVSVTKRPYLIPPNGKGILEIDINAINLSGFYNGTINVYTDKGVEQINFNLKVVPTSRTSKSVSPKSVQDYTYIIWCFAIGIIVVIVLITVLRYKKLKKKKEEKKKEKKEEEEKEEIYYRPQEEYRTEYY